MQLNHIYILFKHFLCLRLTKKNINASIWVNVLLLFKRLFEFVELKDKVPSDNTRAEACV